MEYRIVTRDAFIVLGVEDAANKIDEVDPGFTNLWMHRFMEKHDLVRRYSVDGAYYGMWFGTRGTDISVGTYVAGMIVREDALLPSGWVMRRVEQATFAVFTSTLRDVGSATTYVLETWLPQSEYEQDVTKPRFDYMPPRIEGYDTKVGVWVPVIPK